MALNGMQIYKLLPRKNCKECGFPTCLAFAMKLAQGGQKRKNVLICQMKQRHSLLKLQHHL